MEFRNPFTPSFGKVPPRLAGRTALISDMASAFERGSGNPNLSSILIGARGTGKTALLACIADEARQRGWLAASTTAVPGMLQDILEQSRAAASEFVDLSEGSLISGITVGQLLGVELDRKRAVPGNWRTEMGRLIDALAQHETGLLITVDEVRSDIDEMIELAAVYQHFVQENRKVALVMAGLPYHVESLEEDKAVSFLRRSRHHRLTRIGDADVETAMRMTIMEAGGSVDNEALSMMVDAVDGFAYMLQLVGYWTWEQTKEGRIEAADAENGIRIAEREMQDSVLDATYRELSRGDIRFLVAMAKLGGNCTLAEVSSYMNEKSNYTSKYKTRLLKQGVIGDRGHNHLSIVIPGFGKYVLQREKDEKWG